MQSGKEQKKSRNTTLMWECHFWFPLWPKGFCPITGRVQASLGAWPDIEFTEDRDGCHFTVTVHRKKAESSGKSSGKTEHQIIDLLSDRPNLTIPELAETLNITTRAVEKQILKLRMDGRLRRIGPAKGGHWEIVEKDEK